MAQPRKALIVEAGTRPRGIDGVDVLIGDFRFPDERFSRDDRNRMCEGASR